METQLEQLVALALKDGHLWGARPGTASKTLTVEGKRRHRMRLQADIFGALHAPDHVTPYYPDLRPAIMAAIAEWRAARD